MHWGGKNFKFPIVFKSAGKNKIKTKENGNLYATFWFFGVTLKK